MNTLANFYQRHAEVVWRALRHAGVPRADIPDLAHDVFLILGRKLPTYRPTFPGLSHEDQERAWVHTIAAYEAKNYRAKSASRKQVPMASADEIPDERNDSARLADQQYLLLLLDSLTPERRQVFSLIEIEGFTAPEAARILNLGESNVNRLLRLAKEDMRAEAERLDRSVPVDQDRKSGALLLPFGVGAWTSLREALNPSPGTTARVWKRLEATIAHLDDENDKPSDAPPPPSPPPRGRLTSLGQHLYGPLGHFLSGVVGGLTVALLLLLRPTSSIAVLRIPVPILMTPSSPASPRPLSSAVDALDALPAEPAPSAIPSAGTPVNVEELRLIRQAHVAFNAGDLPGTVAMLKAHDMQFPEGGLRKDARSLWSRVRDRQERLSK